MMWKCFGTRLLMVGLFGVISGLGCDDEKSAQPVIDAEVDATAACDPTGPGHEYCKNLRGDSHFCASSGICAELQPCESDDCCAPGADGDQYCENLCTADVCPRRMSAGLGSACDQPSFMDSVATEPVWTVPMTMQVTDVVQRLLGRPGIGGALVSMPVPEVKIAVPGEERTPSAP